MGESNRTTVVAAGMTDVGLVRKKNEDNLTVADLTTDDWVMGEFVAQQEVGSRGILLAVSDGMGGAEAGDVASALTVHSLRRYLGRDSGDVHVESFGSAVEQVNRDIYSEAIKTGRSQMGATLTAIIIRNDLAHIASVGDTRAYILRERRIRRITKDQSYIAALIDAGCTEEQVRNSPFRNVILQAMGVRQDVVVALGQIALRRGDIFMICTDGLWDKVRDEEVYALVMSSESHDKACTKLIELAKKRGGDDNITVIVAQIQGEHLPQQADDETVTDTYETVREFHPSDINDEE